MRRRLALGAAVVVAVGVTVAAIATQRDPAPEPLTPGAVVGPPATDPCGEAVLKPNGTPWRCTFADDFDGTALDPDHWQPLTTAPTGGPTPECRVDDPGTIAVGGGVLRLQAVRRIAPVTCASDRGSYRTPLVAGGVTTSHRFAQTYGRVEIRAAMPDHRGPGFHSALWMYPQATAYGPWPRSGEIDIVEYRTGLADRAVPTVHWAPAGVHQRVTRWDCVVERPEEFHTYVLEWSAAGMRFVYDGAVCLVVRFDLTLPAPSRPFDRPFFLILNQSHGVAGNAAAAGSPSSATMLVDHVRVWN